MVTKPKSNHSYRSLFLLLPVIVLGAAVAIVSSVEVIDGVKSKSETLIEVHIPALGDVSALQVLMDQRLIMLQKYYETTEPPRYEEITAVNSRFSEHFDNLQLVSLDEDQVETLVEPVQMFLQTARLFSEEMSKGAERNWDKLREHLARATRYADQGREKLETWNQEIRMAATKGGESTLSEVDRLGALQISFNSSIALASLFLVVAVFTHLKNERKLFHRAHHNEVTELPNRRALDEYAREFLASVETKETHAFMLISMDRFAMLTGTYGHVIGDQLLRLFSQSLEVLLRDSNADTRLFSFDRTHWVVCVREVPGLLTGNEVADLIVGFASQPLKANERAYNVSCSVGIAYYPSDANQLAPLVACADTARRAAVDEGGARYSVYQTQMQERAERCLATEMRIRSALRNDQFELHYQPKLGIDGYSVVSAEALIRWPQPNGFVSPGEFIPIAESTGLVVPLGEWGIKRACQDWLAWQAEGIDPPAIAVNISAQQFQSDDFPKLVRGVIEETGMPPEMLELEITEEASSANPLQVVKALNALKAIGVSIAIDDFGTGYSSLSYLKQFPVDVLKIDRAFISQIDSSSNDAAIVKMIIEMAHQLDFKVVAEGVETEAQWRVLSELNCDTLQGFLFSRPLSPEDYLRYMHNRLRSTDVAITS